MNHLPRLVMVPPQIPTQLTAEQLLVIKFIKRLKKDLQNKDKPHTYCRMIPYDKNQCSRCAYESAVRFVHSTAELPIKELIVNIVSANLNLQKELINLNHI